MPDLDPALVEAYRNAIYEIEAESRIILKVSEYSHSLEDLHKRCNCSTSALITACNPRSQILSDAENAQRMAVLTAEIETLGYAHLPAVAKDPEGKWPDEPGLWIAGLTKNEATHLTRSFEQNALLWVEQDAIPQLVLLT
jgi:hypothetical protein